jgi:hypothetical protein
MKQKLVAFFLIIVMVASALAAAGLAATTTVAAATATQTTLGVSNTSPVVNQKVTFTATLKSGSGLLSSKSVTIYHYLGSTRYNDITAKTNANGQVTVTESFGSVGKRTYYADFAGGSSYQTSTSNVVFVYVTASAQLTLTSSTTTPAVNQSVTFTASLKDGTTPLPSQSVTIYHYLGDTRYNDITAKTNASGQITVTTSFGSIGTRSYYATFAGDSAYKAATSSKVTVTVIPPLGIMTGTGPAAAYGVAGSPVLFAVDTSGHVWWTGAGSESGWSSIGGSATSSPAAPTAPSGTRLPRIMGRRGAIGTPSAGRLLRAQDQRPARGAQVV